MARSARLTAQISALIQEDQRKAMDEIADTHEKSFGDVLREVIEAGLGPVVEKYARHEQVVLDDVARSARRG